jgi:hypothetical protein
MKKIFFALLVLILATPIIANATTPRDGRIGEMGFMGGISEGRRLPRTTETVIREQATTNNARNRNNNNQQPPMRYRELIFLGGGEPVMFDGLLEVTNGQRGADTTAGNFTSRYVVRPCTADAPISIAGTMNFNVQYRVYGQQVIYTYLINNSNWTEVITTPAGTWTLDPARSHITISIWQDRTPAVTYYRGDIDAVLVYVGGPTGEVVVTKYGSFHGYSSAWSATETHRLNVSIVNDAWAMTYQIRPSVAVNKELQFVHNEPTIISFEGNYRELHQSFAGLSYSVFVQPPQFWFHPTFGNVSLEVHNVFEQLTAPDLSFMRGHPAENDIHRLFAMQVLTGDPRFFVPEQAITRGQFVTALVRAIKLPVEPVVLPRTARNAQPQALELYRDVDSNRPEFRYIRAASQARVAIGFDDGSFRFDNPITRQEAIVIAVRALGVANNMGLNPTVVTPFADSDSIAYWAMRHVDVAYMLGLIQPDNLGNINPNRMMSKAEAAAFLNDLIDFLRTGILSHYQEQIVNIVR